MERGLLYFFFQAEDGIRDLVRSRGLGDVYKRQNMVCADSWRPLDRRRKWLDNVGAGSHYDPESEDLSLIHI